MTLKSLATQAPHACWVARHWPSRFYLRQSLNAGRTDSLTCRESGDRRSMFLSGRSLQQSDANLTSVEVYVSVSSALKLQCCRSLCFWKFVSLYPICKIEFHLRAVSFLPIGEYASYYRLPLLQRVVGQYIELETLPYLDFRLHLTKTVLTPRQTACKLYSLPRRLNFRRLERVSLLPETQA